MAIVLEEKENKNIWVKIAIIAVLVLILAAAVYYVFFAPVPAFEIIVPPPLESAQKITSFQVDPTNVVNSEAFRILRSYTSLPTTGVLGRDNPFKEL